MLTWVWGSECPVTASAQWMSAYHEGQRYEREQRLVTNAASQVGPDQACKGFTCRGEQLLGAKRARPVGAKGARPLVVCTVCCDACWPSFEPYPGPDNLPWHQGRGWSNTSAVKTCLGARAVNLLISLKYPFPPEVWSLNHLTAA